MIDLPSLSATKNMVDQARAIEMEDHRYLTLESKDQLNLEYIKSPETTSPGSATTYMLVAGGYYRQRSEIATSLANQPLQTSGNLNRYSIARYKELGFDH
jgi:hypothetical protein